MGGEDKARLENPEGLREQYHGEGRSLRDIADELGCSDTTVYRWLGRHGIGTRSKGRAPEELRDEKWLREEYVKEGRSMREIADELGVGGSTVGFWLDEHGLPTRPRLRREVDGRLDDPDWLRERYHREGLTQEEIAEEAGCSIMTVSNRLDEHGIEARPRGPAPR